MIKQNSNQNGKVEKMGVLVKTFDHYRLWINGSWFVIHESNLKFHERIFSKKLQNHES